MRMIAKFRAYENELDRKPLYEQTIVSSCCLSDFVDVEFRLCCPNRKENDNLAAIIQQIKIPCSLCKLIHLGFDVTEYTCCPSDHDHLAEISLSLRGRMDSTLTEVFSVPTGQAKWVCTQISGTFADFLRPQNIRLSLSLPINTGQHVGKMTFLLPKRESVDLCFKPTLAAPQTTDRGKDTYTVFWSVCLDNTRAVFLDEDHEITKEVRVPLGRDYYASAVLLTLLSGDRCGMDTDSQETSVNGDESDNEACLCLTSKSSSKDFGSVDLTLAGDKEQNQILIDSWPQDDRIDELTQPDHSTMAVRAVLESCPESKLLLTFAIPCSSSLTRVLTSSMDCNDI